ncbi:hypothetical protein V6U81_09250 [Micromonospora sp. CPCC 205711]|uniref:hypothetical protein n=1 Tax=Micromonospora sp. CPCC 205547 TaxID=3122400 RepID=UPI002FEF47E3
MTAPAAPPVRPPRPRLVTVAFWLQLAIAALLLVLAGLVVWQAVHWNGEIDRALRLVPDADPEEVSGERFGNVMMACVIGVPAVLLAVALAVTALGIRRGSNAARITVFVIAGVQVLIMLGQGCSGALFLPFLFFLDEGPGEYAPDEYDPGFPEDSKFLDALYGSGPDRSEDVLFAVGGLSLLLVFCLTLAVVVLLVQPTVHRWFVPRSATEARPPVGYHPVPAAFVLPPGYMVCPDPRLHGVPQPGQYPPAPYPPYPSPFAPAPHPAGTSPFAPTPPMEAAPAPEPAPSTPGDAGQGQQDTGGITPPPADPTAPGGTHGG